MSADTAPIVSETRAEAVYRLSKGRKLQLVIWGNALAQIAVPIGSACYFLLTQAHYLVSYPESDGTNGSLVNVWLKDSWDRLPVHIDNFIGVDWFGTANQLAPAWWVVARHDFRKVLIGFIAILLIGAITIGLKKRERATPLRMALSVPAALLAAGATAGVLIAFFAKAVPAVEKWGVAGSVPWVSEWIGRGQLELLVIGAVSAVPARFILARTFDTIQLMSVERNMVQGAVPHWWWKLVYPPNYRERYRILTAAGYEPQPHSRWLGMTLALGAPFLAFLAGFGVWLNYFGPASGAH